LDDFLCPGHGIDGRSPLTQRHEPTRMGNEGTKSQHLIARSTWHLPDQVTDRACQAAPDKAKPHQRESLRFGMTGDAQHADQPVNLARPPPRNAMGTQSGTAHLAVSDLGTWRGHHAVAVEMGTPAKVDAVPEYRQGRVKTVEMPPDRRPYQHPAGGDAKSFLGMIALPLVDLVDIEVELPAA